MSLFDEALRNFKAPKFRPYQKEALKDVCEGLESYDYVFLCLPTGVGKTLINMAVALSFEKSFYLVTTINLQNQIMNDRYLKGTCYLIKGREHYQCLSLKENTCKFGKCRLDKHYSCPYTCPYKEAKEKAIKSQVCLTTLAYFVSEGFVGKLGDRDLCVVDEAHNTPDLLLNFVSLSFRFKDNYNTFDDLVVAIEDRYLELLDELEMLDEIPNKSEDEIEKLDEVQREIRKIEIFKQNADCEWVHEKHQLKKGYKYVLKPLRLNRFAKFLLLRRAKKFIFSSATINAELLADELGIEEYKLVEYPSYFPVERRPIYIVPAGKMTKTGGHYNLNIDYVVRIVRKILELNPDYRGLIHTVSYQTAKDIYDRLIGTGVEGRLILHKQKDYEIIDKWQETKNGVLLSPALYEGIDLPYDKCRFQVLVKVPYLSLDDVRTRERLKRGDWKWYNGSAIIRIVQAYGRAVRAFDDYAKFYILDSAFIKLYLRNRAQFPKYFRDAVRVGVKTNDSFGLQW